MNRCIRYPLFCSLLMMVAIPLVGCSTPGSRKLAQTDRGGPARGQRPRDVGALKVGDTAPLFTLKRLDDQSQTVNLASSRGDRPVVLYFGSYT